MGLGSHKAQPCVGACFGRGDIRTAPQLLRPQIRWSCLSPSMRNPPVFGTPQSTIGSDLQAAFLWEHPVLFDHCVGKISPTLPALEATSFRQLHIGVDVIPLQEVWGSIGTVLVRVAPSQKLWSWCLGTARETGDLALASSQGFSTPDEQVTTQEVRQLARGSDRTVAEWWKGCRRVALLCGATRRIASMTHRRRCCG